MAERGDDETGAGRAPMAGASPGLDESTTTTGPVWIARWRRSALRDAAAADDGGDGSDHADGTASVRSPWVVLATVLLGLFSVGFTITILSNSLPRIARELDSDISVLTWVVTGPLLAFAVLGPTGGKLADLHGQRKVFLWSLVGATVFAAGSVVAPTAGTLVATRVLGAALGAATGPASLAVINRLFAREQRAKAMGWWAMVAAGAPVIGVVAGGPVVEAFGWRWILAAQVPLTLATIVLAARLLPADLPKAERKPSGFDVVGATTLGAAALCLLLAVNRGPSWGWTSPLVLGGLVLAPVLAAAFVAAERRARFPLLPLRYLRRRAFALPLATVACANFAYMGGFVLVPLLLQQEFGHGEGHTGLLLIARPITFALIGPIAGALTVRVGERFAATTGAAALVLSMVGLAMATPDRGDMWVVGALALSGFAMGATSPAMAASVANAVDDDDLGIAGACQQMVNQMGAVIGIQVMQTVQAARVSASGPLDAYGEAFLAGGLVACIGLVLALNVRSTSRRRLARELAGEPEPAEELVGVR